LVPKAIRDIPKKRGRGRPPSGGRKKGIMVRLAGDRLAAVDNWAEQQEDQPSLPEAIRRLVELGLGVKKSKPK
jgi:hypothetical protein